MLDAGDYALQITDSSVASGYIRLGEGTGNDSNFAPTLFSKSLNSTGFSILSEPGSDNSSAAFAGLFIDGRLDGGALVNSPLLVVANFGTAQVRVEPAGHIRTMLGTAGAPIFSFLNDTNTGIYSSGADALDFATAGVRRGGFTSGGGLALVGTLDCTFVRDTNGANRFEMTTSGGGTGRTYVYGRQASSGTAQGVVIAHATGLTHVGAELLTVYRDNVSTKVLGVSKDGKFVTSTGAAGTTGTATLVAGTVTVSTTAIEAGDKIFLTRNTPGGTVGHLSAPVASITAATSFVINSDNAGDTSTVNWWIVK